MTHPVRVTYGSEQLQAFSTEFLELYRRRDPGGKYVCPEIPGHLRHRCLGHLHHSGRAHQVLTQLMLSRPSQAAN